jgi:hypothetical protein
MLEFTGLGDDKAVRKRVVSRDTSSSENKKFADLLISDDLPVLESSQAMVMLAAKQGSAAVHDRLHQRWNTEAIVFALVGAIALNNLTVTLDITAETGGLPRLDVSTRAYMACAYYICIGVGCLANLLALLWVIGLYIQVLCFCLDDDDLIYFMKTYNFNNPEVLGMIGVVLAIISAPLSLFCTRDLYSGASILFYYAMKACMS